MQATIAQLNILKLFFSKNFYPLISAQMSYFMTSVIPQKLFLNKKKQLY